MNNNGLTIYYLHVKLFKPINKVIWKNPIVLYLKYANSLEIDFSIHLFSFFVRILNYSK